MERWMLSWFSRLPKHRNRTIMASDLSLGGQILENRVFGEVHDYRNTSRFRRYEETTIQTLIGQHGEQDFELLNDFGIHYELYRIQRFYHRKDAERRREQEAGPC